MPVDTQSEEYLDFKKIKREASVPVVLAFFDLLDGLVSNGAELIGRCMLGSSEHGKDHSFSFNVEKKTFQCFACKKRGSTLDFVAKITAKREGNGCSLPQAADILQYITDGATAGKYRNNEKGPAWTFEEIERGIEWARGPYVST